VTRLGEFSPIGRLFSLGSFLINRGAQNFGLIFPQIKLYIMFGPKILGLYFGRFFTNPSGHPADNENYS
jgi:hypothetical protein